MSTFSNRRAHWIENIGPSSLSNCLRIFLHLLSSHTENSLPFLVTLTYHDNWFPEVKFWKLQSWIPLVDFPHHYHDARKTYRANKRNDALVVRARFILQTWRRISNSSNTCTRKTYRANKHDDAFQALVYVLILRNNHNNNASAYC